MKYRVVMEQRRVAENQVRVVEKSRAMCRTRAEAAEAELQSLKKQVEVPGGKIVTGEIVTPAPIEGELLDAPKIPGTSVPVELVTLVLKMVIKGAISMRAAARISGLICEFLGGHRLDGLSHATVQNYLLRVGLDQLKQASKPCTDRVWIMEHMIAAGSLKCLIVLGIRAEVYAGLDRPLEHRDVDVLGLIPTLPARPRAELDQREHQNGNSRGARRGLSGSRGAEQTLRDRQSWQPQLFDGPG